MKIIVERETQKQTNKQTNKKTNKDKKEHGGGSYSKRVRAKWFCWTFKLDFLQLVCKASLIFKSNLELTLK